MSCDSAPVGFVGCGRLGLAIAYVLVRAGIPVCLGSRDGGAKATACAQKLGSLARGGSYSTVVQSCHVLFVCLANPGQSDPVCAFLDAHREALSGKGKIIIDPTNPYSYARLPPPQPHQSALTYHAAYLGDPSTHWATAYKSIMWTSIEQYRSACVMHGTGTHARWYHVA
jgi:predicted dinucleotide-binding enzyme